jgi:hypothetical protein
MEHTAHTPHTPEATVESLLAQIASLTEQAQAAREACDYAALSILEADRKAAVQALVALSA